MILAGVDEAGYGPLLGPLVVGCCAFEVETAGDEPVPCVWKRLGRLVSKKRSASGKKLHINDSKLVYSPSDGVKELERSVLAVLCTLAQDSQIPDRFEAMLHQLAGHLGSDLQSYPWYRSPGDERFPIAQDGLPIRLIANALRGQMVRSGAVCVHLQARVVLERQFNQQLAATRNKASVLFSTSAIHLDYLLRTFGHKPMTIVCDQQGGREHYGSLLRLMFDEWKLEVISEGDGIAEYHLRRGMDLVKIIFRPKAEEQCLPVAMASMVSKYLREGLMRRFNAFWRDHIPDVPPTAGYYQDGGRFLRDIEPKRKELGIDDFELIRSK